MAIWPLNHSSGYSSTTEGTEQTEGTEGSEVTECTKGSKRTKGTKGAAVSLGHRTVQPPHRLAARAARCAASCSMTGTQI